MRISNNKKDLGKGAELLQMKDYNIKVKKKKERIDQRQVQRINKLEKRSQ